MSDLGVNIPAHVRKKNGFAVASFITGVLPTVVLGLVFGVLGIRRAQTVGRGTTMSAIGIVLSLAWIAPIVFLTPHVVKSMDPGCRAAKQIQAEYSNSRLAVDFNDPAKFKADNDALIQGLMAAAAKSKRTDAANYMIAEANDQRTVEQIAATQQVLQAGVVERGDTDESALLLACGGF